ncbi:MAG: tetratricopeptide repeat protein [Balneolaceae bacterium]
MVSIDQIYELIQREKFDLALEKLNDALSTYPNETELKRLKAFALSGKDEFEQASQVIKEAIAEDPEYSFLYYTKAQIEGNQGKHKDAIKSLNEAIRLEPETACFYSLKAIVYIDLKKWKKSVETARKALELDPDDIDAQNALATAKNLMGQTSEALDTLVSALEKDPENPSTHANLGYHYLFKGEIKKAKEHFGISLEIDPTSDVTKQGMLEAMKASNIIYRKLVQFYFWSEKIGGKFTWALIIGLLIVINIIPVLVPFYLLLLVWTWVTPPLADMIIFFDKYAKYLMTEDERLLTGINVGLLVISLLSLTASFMTEYSFLFLSFSLFMSIIPLYHIQTNSKTFSKAVVAIFGVAFIAFGIFGTIDMQIYGNSENIFGAPMVGGIIIFTWVNSFLK